METMKRRTKAEKRKKMAGMQKARDMIMAFVDVVVRKGKETKRGTNREPAEVPFYYATIQAQMARSN